MNEFIARARIFWDQNESVVAMLAMFVLLLMVFYKAEKKVVTEGKNGYWRAFVFLLCLAVGTATSFMLVRPRVAEFLLRDAAVPAMIISIIASLAALLITICILGKISKIIIVKDFRSQKILDTIMIIVPIKEDNKGKKLVDDELIQKVKINEN